MKCCECKWWDKTKDLYKDGKWCKCMNPKAPGYNFWREWKNHICKGYGEPKEET